MAWKFNPFTGTFDIASGDGDFTKIQDADADTKIQTEESADEDIIRFDIAGSEIMNLTGDALLPTADITSDLGSSSFRWDWLYGKQIILNETDSFTSGTHGPHLEIDWTTTDTVGGFGGPIWKGLFIDVNYTYDNAAGGTTQNVAAVDIDVDYDLDNALGGFGSPKVITADVSGTASGLGTSFASGVYQFNFGDTSTTAINNMSSGMFQATSNSGNSANRNVALRSIASGIGSGDLVGYQGYANASAGHTGQCIAVFPLNNPVSTSSRAIGFFHNAREFGANLGPSNHYILCGLNGQIIANIGNIWATKSNYAGSGYVDGITATFFANDLNRGHIFAEGGIEAAKELYTKYQLHITDALLSDNEIDISDKSDLASESLNEGDFATHANWDVTNGFDDTGGNATYTHNASGGTLTQTSANMAIAGVGGVYYAFTYTLTTTTSLTYPQTITITSAFAATAVDLLQYGDGTHTIYFKSAASPGDFVISATSAGGQTFTLDDLSLKEVQSGSIQNHSTGVKMASGAINFLAPTNTDLTVTYNGTTNSGVMKWMEDEDYFEVQDDVVFSSDSGLAHGSMYIHNGTGEVSTTGSGTWDEWTTGFTVGFVNNCTFQNSHEIQVDVAGKYLVSWQMSTEPKTAPDSTAIEGGVMINNTINTTTTAHRLLSAGAGDEGSFSGTAILDLAAGDDLSLAINDTGGSSNDIILEHAQLTAVQIAGT